MARVVLFTGKGGVGKTTTAAATALRCADRGQRTIVMSTDPAHSLADSFDVPLGADPTPVTAALWGQQLDAQRRMEEEWADDVAAPADSRPANAIAIAMPSRRKALLTGTGLTWDRKLGPPSGLGR